MIGRTLPPYRVLEEISRGGMGVVYRAEDMRLGREVALKVLPEELLHDPARRQRLIEEARAASSLEHPHIAVIHGVDDVDGVTFVAMELIRGEKLGDALLRGALPPHRALDLAAEIAEGLARAHEKGIVHRDIKPANVMVTEAGHAKIIDFGLAKLAEPDPADAATASARLSHSSPGLVVGTAAYMSPEQARGQRVDHRSDIFSFGVTLFEMLTGRAAFQGASTLDVMHAILTQAVPALPAIAGLAPEAAADVQRILDKCTAKDPDDRYQGMKDVVVDLRQVRRHLDSGARTAATSVARPAAPVGRRSVVVALGLAIAAVALGVWWIRREAAPAADRSGKPAVAVLYFENSTGDPAMDWMRTGLTDMLVTDLAQSRDIEVLATDRLHQILQQLRRADDRVLSAEVVGEVADRAAVDTVLVGSYMKAGATIRINARLQDARTGRIVTSERVEGSGEGSVFSLVDELTRRLMAKITAAVMPAPLLRAPGEPATTGDSLDRGLTDVTTASIEAYKEYAEGINLHSRNLYAQALPYFERAVAIDPTFAMAWAKLAVVVGNLGEVGKAMEFGKRAVDLVDRLSAREQFYIKGYYYSLRQETLAEGIEAYRQAVALYPDHHAARHNLGLKFFQLERFPEAIEQYRELVRRGSDVPSTHGNLAESYLATGDVEASLRTTASFVERHPDSGNGYRYHAASLIAAGRLDEARAALERAEVLNPGFFVTRIAGWTLAMLQGRWQDAEAILEVMAQSNDSVQPMLAGFLGAEVHVLRGRQREATAAFERAIANANRPVEDRAFMRVRQAVLSLRAGQITQALAYARQARTDAGRSDVETPALGVLAIAQAAGGNRAAAQSTLDELDARARSLPADRELRRVHWTRGEIARLTGDRAAAVRELDRAVQMLPAHGPPFGPPTSHPDLLLSAALAHVDAADDGGAARLLQRLQSGYEWLFSPGAYSQSYYLLAGIHERAGNLAAAREQYARFLELWGDGEIRRDWIADARKKLSR